MSFFESCARIKKKRNQGNRKTEKGGEEGGGGGRTGVPESRIFIFESRDRASSAILVFGFLRQWPSSNTTASQALSSGREAAAAEEEEEEEEEAAAAAATCCCCCCFPAAALPPLCRSSLLCRSIPYVVRRTPEPRGGPTAASAAALSAGAPELNSRASTPTTESSAAQVRSSDFGATTSALRTRPLSTAPLRNAATCRVFPRPISSARMPPRKRRRPGGGRDGSREGEAPPSSSPLLEGGATAATPDASDESHEMPSNWCG